MPRRNKTENSYDSATPAGSNSHEGKTLAFLDRLTCRPRSQVGLDICTGK